MKKIITLLAAIGLLFLSCSKDDNSSSNNPPNPPETAQAKAEFDNSNFGFYKGVIVGSSGVISINIKNDGTISAKLVLDGTTYDFTTAGSVTQNEAIKGLTFKNGNMSFAFDADANGSNPIISNISIEGHPLSRIEILKEKSYAIIKCYEGTFSGTDSGVFNAVISNDFLAALAKSVDGSIISVTGKITNNIIDISASNGSIIKGSVSGDTINGTWQANDDPNDNGTWSGKRTL